MSKTRSVVRCSRRLLVALVAALSCAGSLQAASTWYVAPSGSDANTGADWGQALASISNAVAKSAGGDTILVTNGTYGVTAEIVVNKAVSILGLGAPADTIVERSGIQSNRIFNISSSGALIANLTIRKGYIGDMGADGGVGSLKGGAGIFMTGGTVSNCVITANTNSPGGVVDSTGYPWGGGVAMGGGTLWGCTVSSNYALGYGSYGHGIYMSNGVVRDSIVIDNHGRPGEQRGGAGICMLTGNSLVTNTFLARNGNNLGAGGIYYGAGTVVNCVIVSNNLPGVLMLGGRMLTGCELAYNVIANVSLRGNGNVVTNCLIYGGATAVGVLFDSPNAASSISANNLVVDCVVSNQGGLGVSSPASGLSVTNNRVVNGTIVNSGIGIGSAAAVNSNLVQVAGSGSRWSLGGKNIAIGFATATGNVMTIVSTGAVLNAGLVSVLGVQNSIVVSNGATLTANSNVVVGGAGSYSNWFDADSATVATYGLTLGNASSSNSVAVKNGTTWDLRSGVLTWGSGLATNNAWVVDDTSVMTNIGGLSLNEAGQTVYLTNNTFNGKTNIFFSGGGLVAGNAYGLAPVTVIMGDYVLNGAGNTNGGYSGVGLGGSNNTLKVLSGSLWNGGLQTLTVGGPTGTNNLLLLDGQGVAGSAVMTNFYTITVGSNAMRNLMIITNGGQLFSSSTPIIGHLNSPSNMVLIIGGGPAGAPSRWDLGNAPSLFLGGAGSAAGAIDNQLVIDGAGVNGGAVLTNLVELKMANGAGQTGNRTIVKNGGQIYAGQVTVGVQASSNNWLQVLGGGATSRVALTAALYVQNPNFLQVDAANVEGSALATAAGSLILTYGGTAIVTNQGRLSAGALVMGAGNSNRVVVTGTGSLMYVTGAMTVPNGVGQTGTSVRVVDGGSFVGGAGQLSIAVYTSNSLDGVSVASAGKISTYGAVVLATGLGATGNFITVTGTDSAWNLGNQVLTMGGATTSNNVVTIDQGGILDGISTLTVAGWLNSVALRGGTLGVMNTVHTNGPFTVGDGTQVAALKGLGGTLSYPAGLLVASNGVLTGIGTASGAGSGVLLTNGAAVNPGLNGAGTLTVSGSNLTWGGGAAYLCEITNMNLGFGWGWDMLTVSSQALFAAGTTNVIRMDSKGAGAAGFDANKNYMLKILNYGALSGFDPASVILDASAFLSGGDWSLLNTNNSLWLVYAGLAPDDGVSFVWNVPSNGDWSVDGNWAGGAAPAAGGNATNVLSFGDNGIAYTSVNNLAGPFTLNKLMFANVYGRTNFLRGNGLVFDANDTVQPRIEYASGAGRVVVSNPISLSVPTVFGGEGGGVLVLASNVLGGQPLLKEGPWTLALAASNQFAEPILVTGGIVRIDHNQAFGTNTIIVSNGTLQTVAALTLGNGSLLRQALVTGSGYWTNGNTLTVGSNATLTVEGGGRLFTLGGLNFDKTAGQPCSFLLRDGGRYSYSNQFYFGQNSHSNIMFITGPGSVFMGPGDDGSGASWPKFGGSGYAGNLLQIENEGTFTNSRLQTYGSAAVIVTNGGRLFSTSVSMNNNSTISLIGGAFPASTSSCGVVNMNGQGGLFLVDGKGLDGSAVLYGTLTVGQSGGCHNNRFRVTNKGRYTGVGGGSTLYIGAAGATNNAVEILQGSYAKFSAGAGYWGVGGGNGANNNYMLVEDAGSVLEMPFSAYRWEIGFANSAVASNSGNRILVRNNGLMTNAAVLSIASFSTGMNAFNNGVLVSATGRVFSTAAAEVGLVSGVTGNYLKVTDFGSYWSMGNQSITIGHVNGGSTNNYLMITQDGVMENVGNLVVFSNNQIRLLGGTLGLVRSGISNGVPFVVGDGSQTAVLKAQGGQLNAIAGLVITNNAMLTGRGSILSTTTVYGAFSPGIAIGAITNNGPFTLKSGSTTTIELGAYTTPGAGWDLLAVTNGTLQLDGTLSVMLAGGFAPTNTQRFLIMTNLGPASVAGAFANATYGTVPAYAVANGSPVGYFAVSVDPQGVVLGSYSPRRPAPGAVIVLY